MEIVKKFFLKFCCEVLGSISFNLKKCIQLIRLQKDCIFILFSIDNVTLVIILNTEGKDFIGLGRVINL